MILRATHNVVALQMEKNLQQIVNLGRNNPQATPVELMTQAMHTLVSPAPPHCSMHPPMQQPIPAPSLASHPPAAPCPAARA